MLNKKIYLQNVNFSYIIKKYRKGNIIIEIYYVKNKWVPRIEKKDFRKGDFSKITWEFIPKKWKMNKKVYNKYNLLKNDLKTNIKKNYKKNVFPTIDMVG